MYAPVHVEDRMLGVCGVAWLGFFLHPHGRYGAAEIRLLLNARSDRVGTKPLRTFRSWNAAIRMVCMSGRYRPR